MKCKIGNNLEKCNCTYLSCSRRGLCCECVSHHREKGELPACYFSASAERTFDRPIEKFIEDYNNKK